MGFVRNEVRIRLLAAAAITAMAIATPVRAQDGQRRNYNVEAQNLGDALRTVSRLSGREVIFNAEAVEGKSAPRLRGTYTPDDAVRALLDGSGLTAEFRKDVVLIRGRSEAPGEVADASAVQSEILVTGSRIRGAASASPVIVTRREEMLSAGHTDLGTFARSLPQNFTGGQNPGVAGGGNQGRGNQNTNSSSALNLRGLGPDATLTLVNGHRVAYDGVAQGVDISAIPVAAIERIEVVADGSSALYGSDAVGGVANIILRRDFDGVTTSARLGVSTDGGNVQQQYNLVAGSTWASGGVVAALDYSHITEISARQRSYTRTLDDDATLVPRQKQFSVIVAGHQQLADGIAFELDGQFNNRRSETKNLTAPNSSVFANGLHARPDVTTFTVTPTLRFDLPSRWTASVSGTYGRSKTDIETRIFSQGVEAVRTRLLYDNSVHAVELGAEGPIVNVPGGDVRLALGAGYRSVGLDVNVVRTIGGTPSTTADFNAGRDIAFGYGELSVPLISPGNAVPLVEKLSFSGAFRYESYRHVGDIVTPKFGAIYSPLDGVAIKGSWGKSFKAQTLYQEFQIREGNLVPGSIFNGFPPARNVLYLVGGNSELQPERATTWTASLELQPGFLPGLIMEASYFNVRFRDRVVVPFSSTVNALADPTNADIITLNPTVQQLNAAIARLPQGVINLTGTPYDPTTVGAILDGTLQNAARQSVEGVDLALNYRIDLGSAGKLRLSGAASYLKSSQQLNAGKPIVQLAGTIFDPPHWRARGGATYENGNATMSAFVNYIGSNVDDRFNPRRRVGSFLSVDVVARLQSAVSSGPFHGLEANLGLLNLFNEQPKAIRNNNPIDPTYDSTNHPVAGRVISLTLTKSW